MKQNRNNKKKTRQNVELRSISKFTWISGDQKREGYIDSDIHES